MIDFSELSDDEAFAYRDAYAAAAPVRRRWLAAELRAAGQPSSLLNGPGQLAALWHWYTSWFDEAGALSLTLRTPQPADDPQPGARPPWYAQDDPKPLFSNGGLWLIDLVGVHWGLLAMDAIPGSEWMASMYPGDKRGVDVNYRRTMIRRPGAGEFDPASMVYGITVSHFQRSGPWDRYGGLPGLYRHAIERARPNQQPT